jgi:ethanolamine permease
MEKKELKKSLGPIHLWAISVGLVISGDYFGWNYGYIFGVGEFFLAVIFVSLFYICFAFSFTELTTAIPNSGGPFAYSKKAFGNLGGFLGAYFTLVEFLFAAPAISLALGSYLNFLFPFFDATYSALFFLFLFTYINLLGIEQTANFELGITIIASLGILFYLFCIYSHSNPGLVFEKTKNINLFNLFQAIPFAIWFYLAVEGVAMVAEETKNPKKDIPIGYALGIGSLVFFALTVTILTSGLGIEEKLLENDRPLAESLQIIYGKDSILIKIFAFIGLIGIMASLLGIVLGNSRQIFAVARENFLPKYFSVLNKRGVPLRACILGSFIGAVCIVFGNTNKMILLSVLGAISMYIISMCSLILLRRKEPNLERPFKAPFYPFFPVLALILGVICFFSLVYFNLDIFFLFLILLFITFILYFYFRRNL